MRWLRRLFRRDKLETQLDSELRFHVEQQIADNIAAGMPPTEARRRALAQFGGTEYIKEECREARGTHFLETLLQDIRFALRMLRKSPGFTAVAVLTLALGIGASTAVFSVIDGILLRPLPYPRADKIVLLKHVPPPTFNVGFDQFPWARTDALFYLEESKTLASVAAFKSDTFNLSGGGEPVRLDGLRASAGFFPTLGVQPILGRIFAPQDDKLGHEHEVILGYELWRERFGSSANILGQAIDLNGAPYTVIGVMPSGFVFPRASEMPAVFSFLRETQLWVPLALPVGPPVYGEEEDLAMIGRLRDGVTLEQGQAEMDVFRARRDAVRPDAKGWFDAQLVPLAKQVSGDMRRPLFLTLGAVCAVLLISCSNVAGLLLTRSISRWREFALRMALGARATTISRQLFTEELLLAGLGAVAGIAVAQIAVRLIKLYGPSGIPRLSEVGLDAATLVFAVGVTFLAGVLFSVGPVVAASHANLADALRSASARVTGGGTSMRFRNALVVSEIAFALVLVIGGTLLTRTFMQLLRVNPGFNASGALTFELTLPPLKYPDQMHIVSLYQNVRRALGAVPGVESVGVVETTPMEGLTESTAIAIPGRPRTNKKETLYANYTIASPGYFAAAGTPILRGRDFLESDTASSMPVAIINMAMARKYWPNTDPIGRQVAPPIYLKNPSTIVGIVADVKHLSLGEESAPEMYVPYTQKVWPSMLTMDVILRTKMDPAALAQSVREAMRGVDPQLPLAKLQPLAAIVDQSMTPQRFSLLLIGGFGALALLLASIGLYGVISYSVAQRTQEIGIRLALGAQSTQILGMVLKQGVLLAATGLAAGIAIALAVTRLMSGFLYGVRARDPVTFVGAAILMFAVALVACYIPARRAMRVDPMVALRYE